MWARRWVSLVMPAMILSTSGFLGCGETAPPVLTEVPAFTLTRENGTPFGSSLPGQVWVADVIFTTCPSICPMLTTQMGNLERRTRELDVQYVSFTVDPTTDSPEVLLNYARAHDANLDRWAFVTGEPEALQQAIMQGLRLRMGDRTSDGDDILHGSHFVLVDKTMHIRGFYRTDAEGLETLERDLRAIQ